MSWDLICRLANILETDVVYEDGEGKRTPCYFGSGEDSPLRTDPALRRILREGVSSPESPFLYRDAFHVYFGAVMYREGRLYLGPMCSSPLSSLHLKKYYQSHGVTTEDTRPLRIYSLSQIRDIMVFAGSLAQGKEIRGEDVVTDIPEMPDVEPETMKKEEQSAIRQEEADREEGAYRHTYHEEQLASLAIQEGRCEDALRIYQHMDTGTGLFSRQEQVHWRTIAIIDIVLIARAAIAGGISPLLSYQVSGYYIGKCNETADKDEVLYYRDCTIKDLCSHMNRMKSRNTGSGYTARCKDYIQKHYREKISLEDVAAPLGISPGYLSRVFREETGMIIQDYVNHVRVESAANLLIYSEMSLPAIGAYVGFPTQSYFGKYFKKFKGTTPGEFRKQHRASEFWKE